MANPTTNYGFVLPTPTDLVTDLPADFDVALQGVDTRLKALQPGTTLGDLAYSSATANTNTRLGIGSTGNVLTVTGGVPVWAPPAAGGKVLQVVSATTASAVTHATAAYTTTGLTATITPSAATSKILVLTYQAFQASVNSIETANGIQLVRASTVIAGGVNTTDNMGYYVPGAANTQLRLNHNFSVLDNPATTSATTYLVQARPFATANSMQIISNFSDQISSIILLEIGA